MTSNMTSQGLLPARYLVSDARSCPYTVRTYNPPRARFCLALGEEPHVEVALV
jgi:hypothetical protein